MEKTKVYALLYTENSDDRCGSEVEVFTDEQAARAEMQRQYAQTLNNLYHEPDDGDDAPALDERNARISLDGCFNCYSWEITVHEIEVPQLRVKTPLGTLVAADTQNPDYPGIYVDLECDYGGEKAERVGIANVEYGESLRGRREICIATYEDMEADDCTRYLRVDSHGKIKIEK